MNEKVGVILTELENPGRETGTEDKVMISALDILCLTFSRDNLAKFFRIHLEDCPSRQLSLCIYKDNMVRVVKSFPFGCSWVLPTYLQTP